MARVCDMGAGYLVSKGDAAVEVMTVENFVLISARRCKQKQQDRGWVFKNCKCVLCVVCPGSSTLPPPFLLQGPEPCTQNPQQLNQFQRSAANMLDSKVCRCSPAALQLLLGCAAAPLGPYSSICRMWVSRPFWWLASTATCTGRHTHTHTVVGEQSFSCGPLNTVFANAHQPGRKRPAPQQDAGRHQTLAALGGP